MHSCQTFKAIFVLVLAFLPPHSNARIDITFDYSLDANGFFSGENLNRRLVLDAAAEVFESRLASHQMSDITPNGINTWTLFFQNPSTGTLFSAQDLAVPQDQVRIFVGAQDLPEDQIGVAQFSYSYYGTTDWVDLFTSRNNSSTFQSFGGAISFDSEAPWYFDDDVSSVEDFGNRYDFYSLAQHEIVHILGFVAGPPAFSARVNGSNYVGEHAVSLYGGPIPLNPDLYHWQESLHFDDLPALMSGGFYFNERKFATELDFAVLQDLGYRIAPVPEPASLSFLVLGLLTLFLIRRLKPNFAENTVQGRTRATS